MYTFTMKVEHRILDYNNDYCLRAAHLDKKNIMLTTITIK